MIGCALGGPDRCADPAAVVVEGGNLAVPACRPHGDRAARTAGTVVRALPAERPRPARPGRARTAAVLAFPGALPAVP